MIRNCKLLVLFILIFTIFTGCQNPTNTQETHKKVENKNEMRKKAQQVEIVPSEFQEKWNDYTVIRTQETDVDMDGDKEKITLSTSAKPNEDGKINGSEKADWLVYLEDENGIYVLMDKELLYGTVYFDVADRFGDDKSLPKITVAVSSEDDLKIKNFYYQKKTKTFLTEAIFDTTNLPLTK